MHKFDEWSSGEFLDAEPKRFLPGRVQPFEVPVVTGDAEHVQRQGEKLSVLAATSVGVHDSLRFGLRYLDMPPCGVL
jgi:hypothetical protein